MRRVVLTVFAIFRQEALGLLPSWPIWPCFGVILSTRYYRSVQDLRKTPTPVATPIIRRSPRSLISLIPKHWRRNTKSLMREDRAVRRPVPAGRAVVTGPRRRAFLALLAAKDIAKGRLRRAGYPWSPLLLCGRRLVGVALGRVCCCCRCCCWGPAVRGCWGYTQGVGLLPRLDAGAEVFESLLEFCYPGRFRSFSFAWGRWYLC